MSPFTTLSSACLSPARRGWWLAGSHLAGTELSLVAAPQFSHSLSVPWELGPLSSKLHLEHRRLTGKLRKRRRHTQVGRKRKKREESEKRGEKEEQKENEKGRR